MASASDPTLAWLVHEADPAVQVMARRDLLDQPAANADALSSPLVRGLLADISRVHPYAKWAGAHWRLVSLVELGIPVGEPSAVAACEIVLGHWASQQRLAKVPVVAGLARRCASQEGNAVAAACRLGLAGDARVALLVKHLVAWQWPDGGWNCDPRPQVTHSSFHETLPAVWGLHEYRAATGDGACGQAVRAAGKLLLEHELVFSGRTGGPIHPSFVKPHYPPYWHYDLLQALLVLHRAGLGADPRTARARQLLAGLRRRDGRWRAVGRWWRPPGAPGGNVEAVDWADVAHQMVTLNALRVGAGREAQH